MVSFPSSTKAKNLNLLYFQGSFFHPGISLQEEKHFDFCRFNYWHKGPSGSYGTHSFPQNKIGSELAGATHCDPSKMPPFISLVSILCQACAEARSNKAQPQPRGETGVETERSARSESCRS